MIIGLHGKRLAGKNTVADFLREIQPRTAVLSFVQPLRDFVRSVYNLSPEHIDGNLKDLVVPSLGRSPRQILQDLAQYCLGIDPYCFTTNAVNEALLLLRTEKSMPVPRSSITAKGTTRPGSSFIQRTDLVVFVDCRMKQNAEAIKEAGGEVWHIIRPDVIYSKEANSVDAHLTENVEVSPDVIIVNDGSLSQLKQRVKESYAGIVPRSRERDRQEQEQRIQEYEGNQP